MTARGFSVVPLLAFLTACGGAGLSSNPNLPARGADGVAVQGAGQSATIKWSRPTVTLHGHRPGYSGLVFTAGDTYAEHNQCGNAILYQRVSELTRGSLTTFIFEFISNSRGPLTCTITDTLQAGSQPTTTLTINLK